MRPSKAKKKGEQGDSVLTSVFRDGTKYSRIPRLQFPADEQGRTVLIHNLTHYSKDALYRQVESWLAGNGTASGKFGEKGSITPTCKAHPLSLRQGQEKMPIRGCENWVATSTFGKTTFGLQWQQAVLEPWNGAWRRGSFPDYFKQAGKEMQAVTVGSVPDATGLKEARFKPAVANQSYTSPETGENCWKKPGPKAGPFTAKLTDGSVVTYWWYRFIDQPSLQDADLSETERARLQSVVEKIHKNWLPDKEYLPPPGMGTLAALDDALLVTPPQGLEAGYVPIVTRQAR
jgi:hypothetical protein